MSPASISIALITSLIVFSKGTVALTFTPNCTLPTDHINYVSGTNVRNTLGILWNCFSIILLCTWNILHLNIPAQGPSTSSIVQKSWGAIWNSGTKVKWMIITISSPEILLGKALDEFLSTRESWIDDLANLAMDDETEWGPIHTSFANMGGFVLDFSEILDQQFPEPRSNILVSMVNEMLSDCNYELSQYRFIVLRRMTHKFWTLTSRQVLVARKCGLIRVLPQVSEKTLAKFDKGNILLKILAVTQISWLVIQLIVRKIAALPSSQLEVATLAFSVSGVITCLFYWNRLQDVENIWVMKASRLPTKQEIKSFMHARLSYWCDVKIKMPSKTSIDSGCDFLPVPNTRLSSRGFDAARSNVVGFNLGVMTGGTVFGSLHCLAWNFQFPTPAEALLWKFCSITTTIIPFVAFFVITGLEYLMNWGSKRNGCLYKQNIVQILRSCFLWGCIIFYFLARLFLLIEIFRTLFFLPPEAFIDTWSGTLHHWD